MQETIQKIEEIFGITLKEYSSGEEEGNTYSATRRGIESLRLDSVTVDSVDELLPFVETLTNLSVSNSTVSNISELLKLDLWSLSIENVVFTHDAFDASILEGITYKKALKQVNITSTNFNAAAMAGFEDLMFLFLNDCHIENFGAFSNHARLYQLELTYVTFAKTIDYLPQPYERNIHVALELDGCEIENIDFFQPFANCLGSITLINSTVHNIDGIDQFPELAALTIDESSTVHCHASKDKTKQVAPNGSLLCEVTGEGETISLAQLVPIAHLFTTLKLEDCLTQTLEGLEYFINVKHLAFSKSDAHLSAFVPIAPQIKTICFINCGLLEPAFWSHFTQLESLEAAVYDEEREGLKVLENILPLKHQLKRLELHEELPDDQRISEFTALEELTIFDASPETAASCLTISALKRLVLGAYTDEEKVLSLSKLINLEYLRIEEADTYRFTGFEHLKKLECLEIEEGYVDVNTLPSMPNLKRLQVDMNHYQVDGLAQFHNLEQLKIGGAKSIKLSNLHKLKVLDLANNIYVEEFNCFDDLPNLERLSLSDLGEVDVVESLKLTALRNLKQLRYLTLEQTKLETLEGIEELERLEYLNLSRTSLKDVKVLNKLKHLKEVDLWVGTYCDQDEMRSQLDDPSIAIFPRFQGEQFRVWTR